MRPIHLATPHLTPACVRTAAGVAASSCVSLCSHQPALGILVVTARLLLSCEQAPFRVSTATMDPAAAAKMMANMSPQVSAGRWDGEDEDEAVWWSVGNGTFGRNYAAGPSHVPTLLVRPAPLTATTADESDDGQHGPQCYGALPPLEPHANRAERRPRRSTTSPHFCLDKHTVSDTGLYLSLHLLPPHQGTML